MKGFGILPVALAAGLAGLSGCGGGGGSEDGPSYSGSTEKVAVTDRATANTLVSNTACTLLAVCAGASKAPTMAGSATPRVSEATGAFKTTKTPCSQGGSKTVTQSDDGYFDVGHTSATEYDQCAEYDRSSGGLRWDGTHSWEITAVTGTPLESGDWSISELWQYDTFRIDTLDGSGRSLGYTLFHGNGSMTQRPGTSLDYMEDTRYTSLYTKATYGTPNELLRRNGSLHEEWNANHDHVITGREGEVCSTLMGGCVTLHTPTYLNFPRGYGYAPDAGQMVITAADNAKIQVTIIDATQINIEYDIDPIDGDYEGSETMTWDAL